LQERVSLLTRLRLTRLLRRKPRRKPGSRLRRLLLRRPQLRGLR
jgi:hypothetical protein